MPISVFFVCEKRLIGDMFVCFAIFTLGENSSENATIIKYCVNSLILVPISFKKIKKRNM
jgi:hypothetical protein